MAERTENMQKPSPAEDSERTIMKGKREKWKQAREAELNNDRPTERCYEVAIFFCLFHALSLSLSPPSPSPFLTHTLTFLPFLLSLSFHTVLMLFSQECSQLYKWINFNIFDQVSVYKGISLQNFGTSWHHTFQLCFWILTLCKYRKLLNISIASKAGQK